MFFCEPTTNCEHKAQKILRTGGKSPSMFCDLFFLRPTSSAGTAHPQSKRLHLQLKP